MASEIDGVDHRVEAIIENFCSGLFVEKFWHNFHFTVGMDGECAVCHGIGFLSTNLAIHRVKLTIDVGDADFVEVDESEVADA